jgi:hypothetical protein
MRAPSRPVAVLVASASAALASAAGYEGPRTFRASELLQPSQISGPRFSVAPEVRTEGYLHVFDVTTDWGPIEAEGRSLLIVRLHEVGALATLDEVSRSRVFLEAAGNSVVRVGKGVVSAVTDPEATARGIGGGLKRFGTNLGRKAKRLGDKAVDAVKKDDEEEEAGRREAERSAGAKAAGAAGGAAKSVLGVNAAARRWAQKVGVDPYTTNPILKEALEDVAKVDAAGGIATKLLLPIPMVVGTTATVGHLVWGKDPEELMKHNEGRLRELGAGGDTIRRLYLSKGFTLTLQTRLVGALAAVGARGSADYADTAAEADAEREAVFFAESAEMLQRLHARAPVVSLLPDSRALVAKTRDGGAVLLLPVDWIRWTEAFERSAAEVAERAAAEMGTARLELRTTGRLSETARKELEARGWTVAEGVPSSAGLVATAAVAP